MLIEGPSDFNDRLDELALPHRLPIAIYSYVRLPDGARRGRVLPVLRHSPEWQALRSGGEVGAEVRFIDLPWADVARDDERRATATPTPSSAAAQYVARCAGKLGVEDFDALWDTLFELDPGMDAGEYLRRAHPLRPHAAARRRGPRRSDRRREAFMAARFGESMGQHAGRVLVVTGGYPLLCRCTGALATGRPGDDGPPDCARRRPASARSAAWP